MKFLKTVLMMFWLGVALLAIYYYWTGFWPEQMQGTPSSSGIEVYLKLTGTRGPSVEYHTLMTLETGDGERFVYDLDALGDAQGVDALVNSMTWLDGETLSFENQPKHRLVTISYEGGLWSLQERPIAP